MPRLSPIGTDFTVNTNTEDNQSNPTVAVLENGTFVVTWTSNDIDDEVNGISAQLFAADGTPIGDEFLVNTEIEASQLHPSVAALPNGGFVITWYSFDRDVDGSGAGVAAQIFDADGNTVGDEFTVNTETAADQFAPEVTALEGGGFVIAWASGDADVDGSGYGIAAQIFDANGNTVGSEFTVNTEVDSHQYHPSIASLANGGFVVTWYSYDPDVDSSLDDLNSGIAARIYSADGTALGDEFTVNSATNNNQFIPNVTGLSGGGFVVTWYSQDDSVDGDETGISARIFDASGNPVTDEFTVNSEVESNQLNPVVTELEDGRFVISWVSDDPDVDGDRTGISGQLYEADGTPVGDEFTINDAGDYNQLFPALAPTPDGGFIAVWTNESPEGDGNGYAISARIFKPDLSTGTDGDDQMFGNEWDNSFEGEGGADTIYASSGDDSVIGGSGNDTMGGGADEDTLSGEAGDDKIFGGSGNDIVSGGTGNDKLYGGAGNDMVNGGDGADTLWGSAGDDTLTGGDGADRFSFKTGHGDDVITDFDASEDTLALLEVFESRDAMVAAASDQSEGVLIDLGSGNSLLITNLTVDDLATINLVL